MSTHSIAWIEIGARSRSRSAGTRLSGVSDPARRWRGPRRRSDLSELARDAMPIGETIASVLASQPPQLYRGGA